MGQRIRLNSWNKPFIKINNLEYFSKISGSPNKKHSKQMVDLSSMPDITVPKFQIINKSNEMEIETPPICPSIPINYVRTALENIPKRFVYEMMEGDDDFIKHLNQKLGAFLFSGAILEKCFVFLEKGTKKQMRPQYNQIQFLQIFLEQILQKGQTIFRKTRIQFAAKNIWCYWLKRRQIFKGPLLREFRRPGRKNRDFHRAFRLRKKISDEKAPISNDKQLERIIKKQQQKNSLNLLTALAAASRIQEGIDVEEMRMQFQGFHNYVGCVLNMEVPTTFKEPAIDTEASQYKEFLEKCKSKLDDCSMNEYRGNNLPTINMLLGLYNLKVDLGISPIPNKFPEPPKLDLQKALEQLKALGFEKEEIEDSQNCEFQELVARKKQKRVTFASPLDQLEDISKRVGVMIRKKKRQRPRWQEHLPNDSEEQQNNKKRFRRLKRKD